MSEQNPMGKPLVATPQLSLRRLFLTLFLRGRTSRGLRKQTAPTSIGSKLLLTLLFYAGFGLFAGFFVNLPTFSLSMYLHGMTLVFLGMFVAASAGEVLFNKEESDILLHRPVTPRDLLRAKIGVLVEVSLWLAGAFNLTGFILGVFTPDGSWLFLPAHAASTAMQALFCTGCVVLVYQLCLRWFGRERLEGLMTMAQVLVAIAAVSMGQIVPRLIGKIGPGRTQLNAWWTHFLPPTWFAGFDDAIAGSGQPKSWMLAGIAVLVTFVVLWLAFGKLAQAYETGLQALNETTNKLKKSDGRKRWISALAGTPPLCWCLRDPISRASFILTGAYLFRDRDVKLRVYPGFAPLLIMPVVFLLQDSGKGGGGLAVAFAGTFLSILPMTGQDLLRYSQHWQASDLFHVAPTHGPAAICHGTRSAVYCFLTFPLLLLFGVLAFLFHGCFNFALAVPGLMAMPVLALIPSLSGRNVPLSSAPEEAKASGRGIVMLGATLASMALGGAAIAAWHFGVFKWLLLGEGLVMAALYFLLKRAINRNQWCSLE